MKKTICLNMIVKNESKNLERLFKSLYKVIDYYVIHDTGSTDGTPEKIKEILGNYGISGEIHYEKWKNFGYNRQKAFDSLINSKYKADYLLWIDADEELYFKDLELFNNLTKDCYNIKRIYGSIDYYNPHLIRINNNNDIGWKWKGPVHNYISNDKPYTRENIDKDIVHIKSYAGGGAKSHDVTSEEKYLRDAKLLLEYLEEHPNDPRSIFYLAQSYKDTGKMYEEAIKWYKKRLEVGGWDQEKYMSCYNIGNLLRRLGNTKEAFYYYLLSYEYDNSRYECFYEMIVHYRKQGKRKTALSLYKQLRPVNINSGKLFLVSAVHDWKLDFELTIIPYYAKEYNYAINAFKRLFKNRKIPKNIARLIIKNFGFYEKYMSKIDNDMLVQEKIKFEDFYFPKQTIPENLFNTNEKIKIMKEEVKEEIILKSVEFDELNDKGISLTVTEKLN